MDTASSKRVGLLDEYLSEAEIAAELNKDLRTLMRWRKLRIGPPFVMAGMTPLYSIGLARQWLAAGGTAAVKKPQTASKTKHRAIKRAEAGGRS